MDFIQPLGQASINRWMAKETIRGSLRKHSVAILAENADKWITIHPHGEESDDYRRLLIKDGETVEDAMHRQGYYNKRQAKEEKEQKGNGKNARAHRRKQDK